MAGDEFDGLATVDRERRAGPRDVGLAGTNGQP